MHFPWVRLVENLGSVPEGSRRTLGRAPGYREDLMRLNALLGDLPQTTGRQQVEEKRQ